MRIDSTLQRRRHLEDDHFRRVDLELRHQLFDQLEHDRRVESLRSTTRVRDEAVLAELAEAGFDADSLPALSLYPIVLVAWSDGFVGPEERRRILVAAKSFGCTPGTTAYDRLQEWLTDGPSVRLSEAWRNHTRAVCAMCTPEARRAMKHAWLVQVRFVAMASGGVLGMGAISTAEQRVLDDVASAFDEGE